MSKHFGRVGLVLVAGALLTPLWAGTAAAIPVGPPAGASGPPKGGCPANGGWSLVQPSGPEHRSAQYDFNGDGYVCARSEPGGISFMDNVVR
jgi:hypothetical protein